MNARWSVEQRDDGTAVVRVTGDVDMAVEEALHTAVLDCAEAASRSGGTVDIDLDGVEFMDSAGLRSLMRLHIEHGDVITIRRVSSPVARLFEIAGVADWLMAGASGEPGTDDRDDATVMGASAPGSGTGRS